MSESAPKLEDCRVELQSNDADSLSSNMLNGLRKGGMRTRGSREGTRKTNYAEVSESADEEDEDEQLSDGFAEKTTKGKNARPIVLSSDSEDKKQKPSRDTQPTKKIKVNSSRKRKSTTTARLLTNSNSESSSESEDDVEEPPKSRPRLRAKTKSKVNGSTTRSRILREDTSSSSDSRQSDRSSDDNNRKPKRESKKYAKKRTKKKGEKKPRNMGRRKIKKIIEEKDLLEQTKEARREESERLKRLQERQKSSQSDCDIAGSPEKKAEGSNVILQKEPLVQISPYISQSLRPHQIEGVRFIWDNLVESTQRAKTTSGGGCILAHCMGLGKTLQTIASVHTFVKSSHLDLKKIMIVAPMNTVRNWVAEFVQWCEDGDELELYSMAEARSNKERVTLLKRWRQKGGVLIIGYDMYRIMTTRLRYKAWKEVVKECLVDPGPDVVVCDEGHMLKNASSNISKELSKVKTRRRLVLTGTPLQNNLVEYHCMVNFVKPDLLGSLKEFRNRFVNPIVNGQHTDSTKADVNVMKRRSHVLHQMLSGFVQRKDYSVLKPYLSSKFEYVLKVRLTPLQIKLYQHYLDTMTNRGTDSSIVNTYGKGASLFADYQNLMRVWTHPKSLLMHTVRKEKQAERDAANNSSEEEPEASETDEWATSNDEESDDSSGKRKTRGSLEKDDKPVKNDTNGKDVPQEDVKDKQNGEEEATTSTKPKSENLSGSGDEAPNRRKTRQTKRRKPVIEEESSSEEKDEESSESSCSQSDFSNEEKEEDGESSDQVSRRSERLQRRNRSRRLLDDEDGEGDGEEEVEIKEVGADEWYASLLPEDRESLETYQNSSKITLLFEILKLAEERKEKVLVFSQSLVSLDLIEMKLATSWGKADEEEGAEDGGDETLPSQAKITSIYGGWYRNVDYFRMDGSTLGHHRQRWINAFNDENDHRSRLFLISTKAGSLGVNLVGANRVIIFDTSWNPSHDTQSIFRVYRFGQTRSCYIYRFIAEGTMEEKIYQRQVNKQSLAIRVVDEQQINRYFTASSLAEMYAFNPTTPESDKDKPTPVVPKDQVLAELLSDPRTRHLIATYHEHDSLLDHQVDQELTEEERKAAWEEYELEKKRGFALPGYGDIRPVPAPQSVPNQHGQNQFNPHNSLQMMAKVNKLMQDAYIKVRSYETKPIKSIIEQLRSAPLYANSDEEMLQTIAREVNQRLSSKRHEAQAQFQTLQLHYKTLQQQYFKNLSEMMGVSTASTAAPFAGASNQTFKFHQASIPSRAALLKQMAGPPHVENGDAGPLQTSTKIEVIEVSDSDETQSTSK